MARHKLRKLSFPTLLAQTSRLALPSRCWSRHPRRGPEWVIEIAAAAVSALRSNRPRPHLFRRKPVQRHRLNPTHAEHEVKLPAVMRLVFDPVFTAAVNLIYPEVRYG